jgi:hypothetical protein
VAFFVMRLPHRRSIQRFARDRYRFAGRTALRRKKFFDNIQMADTRLWFPSIFVSKKSFSRFSAGKEIFLMQEKQTYEW